MSPGWIHSIHPDTSNPTSIPGTVSQCRDGSRGIRSCRTRKEKGCEKSTWAHPWGWRRAWKAARRHVPIPRGRGGCEEGALRD